MLSLSVCPLSTAEVVGVRVGKNDTLYKPGPKARTKSTNMKERKKTMIYGCVA
jgi:hypothetical protein